MAALGLVLSFGTLGALSGKRARVRDFEADIKELDFAIDLAKYATNRFTNRSTGEFSAVTVFDGLRRLIVYNDSHSPGRQSSDLAHEISHSLLLHEPRPALDASGCRDWDEASEDEADWLGGALLISDEAAIWIAQRRLSLNEAAATFGVSTALVNWRLNVTGARRRVDRARRFRG